MAKRQSNVDRVHEALRQKAVSFAFMPDQKLNESALAAELETSRTPLREALNRLVAEGLLTFQTNRGFFCRSLTPKDILDLYEARVAIECEAVRLSCARASQDAIEALAHWLREMESLYRSSDDPLELLKVDEAFHLKLVELSGNSELVRLLANVNDRIRYIRLIDLKNMRDRNGGDPEAHNKIVQALLRRDAVAAEAAMRSHIEKRREQATEAVRTAFSQLYVPQE